LVACVRGLRNVGVGLSVLGTYISCSSRTKFVRTVANNGEDLKFGKRVIGHKFHNSTTLSQMHVDLKAHERIEELSSKLFALSTAAAFVAAFTITASQQRCLSNWISVGYGLKAS